jgi:hypothetical protein
MLKCALPREGAPAFYFFLHLMKVLTLMPAEHTHRHRT